MEKKLLVWDVNDSTIKSVIAFENGFTASIMMHPATYLNKILVASQEGSLQIWNIKTQTCIYTFSPSALRPRLESRNPGTITCIAQAAIDVVGIGFSTGEVIVHDIAADEPIARFFMEGGAVRSIAFRNGEKILATASASGAIAFWDLEENALLHLLRSAHEGAVSYVEWIPGHSLLVSSGEDNAVKQWVLDSPAAPPRLLKFRAGHIGPPSILRFYGDDGKALLSAGSTDRAVRMTSVVRDARSTELSQGSGKNAKAAAMGVAPRALKFAPVTSLSFSAARAKEWDGVLTGHKDEFGARTWSMQNLRIGAHVFAPPEGTDAISAVHVSACGNFGVCATRGGQVAAWSMQSGLLRRSYKLPTPGVVSGLASDVLNRTLVVATLAGVLTFFDFHTGAVQGTLKLKSSADVVVLQRDAGMLAVCCSDAHIRVIDMETQRVVRDLECRARIRDVTWSADARWIIVACYDRAIRTFDVPSGHLVDIFRTPDVPTSVAMSPTGEFLATTHVNRLGIYLWANRAQYTEVPLRTVDENEIQEIGIPSVQGQAEEDALEALANMTLQDAQAVFDSPNQLHEELVTLTLLPRAKWQTLLNLDVIAQRNKPKEPPKAPEQAPFFLPTLPGVEHRFAVDSATTDVPPTKELKHGAMDTAESEFVRRLAEEDVDSDHEDFFVYARELSPAALDVELRGLTRLPVLERFTRALAARLHSRRDFEAVQAMMGVLLHVHGDVLVENVELRACLEALQEAQRKETVRILEMTAQALGTLAFVQAAP